MTFEEYVRQRLASGDCPTDEAPLLVELLKGFEAAALEKKRMALIEKMVNHLSNYIDAVANDNGPFQFDPPEADLRAFLFQHILPVAKE